MKEEMIRFGDRLDLGDKIIVVFLKVYIINIYDFFEGEKNYFKIFLFGN